MPIKVDPDTCDTEAHKIALRIERGSRLYGVPRGGIPAAYLVASHCRGRVVYDINQADVIIDDIVDSGITKERYRARINLPFLALFDKSSDARWKDQWLVMPWETEGETTDASADDIVIRLLQYIGEDPTREGLRDTPKRYLSAWKEWTSGYGQDPKEILKTFADGAKGYDELIVVHQIPFLSHCEHHLSDIIGYAHVGYIPDGLIVGLSKIPRLVDMFARRLQVQEAATVQIADAMMEHLRPKGVGVIIRAAHACMSTRGVRIHSSMTTTSAMRGALLDKGTARQEFIDLCRMAENKA